MGDLGAPPQLLEEYNNEGRIELGLLKYSKLC